MAAARDEDSPVPAPLMAAARDEDDSQLIRTISLKQGEAHSTVPLGPTLVEKHEKRQEELTGRNKSMARQMCRGRVTSALATLGLR